MIQFQCDACLAYVRASNAKAGKRVFCPHCGAKVYVPDPDFLGETAATEGAAVDELDELSGAGQGGDAWSEELGDVDNLSDLVEPKTEWPAPPQQDEDDADGAAPDNDEKEEQDDAESSTSAAKKSVKREHYLPKIDDPLRRKVFWPAVGVLLVTLFALLMSLLYVPVIAWQVYQVFQENPDVDGCFIALQMIATIISSVYYILVLSRGIHMLLMTDYEQAMVSAGLVMMPCSLCCVVGIPVGLWAFSVLRDPQVKQAFKK